MPEIFTSLMIRVSGAAVTTQKSLKLDGHVACNNEILRTFFF